MLRSVILVGDLVEVRVVEHDFGAHNVKKNEKRPVFLVSLEFSPLFGVLHWCTEHSGKKQSNDYRQRYGYDE